jgi:hypothetical protein
MFLFSGNLVMSIAPEGVGSHLVELSEYTAPLRSIKAEMAFPLRDEVLPSVPYDRVRYGDGTTCGGCHGPEDPLAGIGFARAYESDLIRPRTQEIVSLDYLKEQTATCDRDRETYRCDMLTAVFGHGDIDQRTFPPQARTIFGAE